MEGCLKAEPVMVGVLLVSEWRRLATAVDALRRTIDESRALVAAVTLSRLERDYEALDLRRERLINDAKQLTGNSTQRDHAALALRVAEFYRDVGEVECRAAGSPTLPAHVTLKIGAGRRCPFQAAKLG
jgi:hypothetical protein